MYDGVPCPAAGVIAGVGSASCTVVLDGTSPDACGCELSQAIVKADATKAETVAANLIPTARSQRRRESHIELIVTLSSSMHTFATQA